MRSGLSVAVAAGVRIATEAVAETGCVSISLCVPAYAYQPMRTSLCASAYAYQPMCIILCIRVYACRPTRSTL
eukprot:1068765-Rhodomonas_salina.1